MSETHALVVTISATYGAGSSVIGPQVATELGLPYFERMVSPSVARQASPPRAVSESAKESESALTEAEKGESLWRRIFEALTSLPSVTGDTVPLPGDEPSTDERLRTEVEASIKTGTSERGGVVVGRGATCFLAGRPGTFHVRLQGPRERRIEQAAKIEQLDTSEAARRLDEVDRTRAAYVRRMYGHDIADPTLYHLVLDSTVVSFDVCTDLIVRAVRAAFPA